VLALHHLRHLRPFKRLASGQKAWPVLLFQNELIETDRLEGGVRLGLTIINANKTQVQTGPSTAQIASDYLFVC